MTLEFESTPLHQESRLTLLSMDRFREVPQTFVFDTTCDGRRAILIVSQSIHTYTTLLTDCLGAIIHVLTHVDTNTYTKTLLQVSQSPIPNSVFICGAKPCCMRCIWCYQERRSVKRCLKWGVSCRSTNRESHYSIGNPAVG